MLNFMNWLRGPRWPSYRGFGSACIGIVLALSRVGRDGCVRGCRGRHCVDHLARTGVVQFLAGLVLDCIGVVLKPIDVPLEQLVFSLQVMELAIQRSRILAFLLVHSEPI